MRHCLTYIPEPGDLFWDNKDNKIVCCLENDISDPDTIKLERFYTMSDTEVYERPMNIPFNERYSPIENSPEMYALDQVLWDKETGGVHQVTSIKYDNNPISSTPTRVMTITPCATMSNPNTVVPIIDSSVDYTYTAAQKFAQTPPPDVLKQIMADRGFELKRIHDPSEKHDAEFNLSQACLETKFSIYMFVEGKAYEISTDVLSAPYNFTALLLRASENYLTFARVFRHYKVPYGTEITKFTIFPEDVQRHNVRINLVNSFKLPE